MNDFWRGLASIQSLRARFEEEKRIVLLVSPLRTSGQIDFLKEKNGQVRFARRTFTPTATALIVNQQRMEINDGQRVQRIDFANQPFVRSFVGALFDLLQGKREFIEQQYEVQFQSKENKSWKLELRPKNEPLSRLIEELGFEGTGNLIHQMTIKEKTGDLSITSFSQTQINYSYSQDEIARVFSPLVLSN
ncbi:MAG: outer membrane lipoprotein carrier protein LolA [Sandaracinaceae bacterium]|nr:outer membrane lipoprotein carrier protein LolA [Sandaracinaceae bacterium]